MGSLGNDGRGGTRFGRPGGARGDRRSRQSLEPAESVGPHARSLSCGGWCASGPRVRTSWRAGSAHPWPSCSTMHGGWRREAGCWSATRMFRRSRLPRVSSARPSGRPAALSGARDRRQRPLRCGRCVPRHSASESQRLRTTRFFTWSSLLLDDGDDNAQTCAYIRPSVCRRDMRTHCMRRGP